MSLKEGINCLLVNTVEKRRNVFVLLFFKLNGVIPSSKYSTNKGLRKISGFFWQNHKFVPIVEDSEAPNNKRSFISVMLSVSHGKV